MTGVLRYPAPSCRPPAVEANLFGTVADYAPPMSPPPPPDTVGPRPSELVLYRCLVCGFQSLKGDEIGEHLMQHTEAAKYTFATVVK